MSHDIKTYGDIKPGDLIVWSAHERVLEAYIVIGMEPPHRQHGQMRVTLLRTELLGTFQWGTISQYWWAPETTLYNNMTVIRS